MTAYGFWNVREVHDPEAMADYVAKVTETVERYGGEYLVVGGPWEAVEGQWQPSYPVIIRFASMDAARAWYDSPEYAPLKEQRLRATVGDAVFLSAAGAIEHLERRAAQPRTNAAHASFTGSAPPERSGSIPTPA